MDTSIRVTFNTKTFSGLVPSTQTNKASIHFHLDQKSVILRKRHDFEIDFPTLQHTLPCCQLTPELSAGLTNTTSDFYELLGPEVFKPLVSYYHLLTS